MKGKNTDNLIIIGVIVGFGPAVLLCVHLFKVLTDGSYPAIGSDDENSDHQ